MSTLSPATRQNLLSLLTLIGFFAIWELACVAFNVSSLILPKPSQIAMVLITKMPLLWPHTAQTLYTTLVGFGIGVLVGIVLGMLIGSSKLAYNVAYPLLVGFSSIPKVAVVPIFVVWFGAGTVPAILTSAVISIFPVVVNVATGLATTEPELEDVLRALGATKRDILWNVGLPRTMPYLGMGWGQSFARGWTVHADLGALLGKAKVTGSLTPSLRAKIAAAGPGIDPDAELDRELQQVRDGVDKASFYPVLQLGVSYRW